MPRVHIFKSFKVHFIPLSITNTLTHHASPPPIPNEEGGFPIVIVHNIPVPVLYCTYECTVRVYLNYKYYFYVFERKEAKPGQAKRTNGKRGGRVAIPFCS
mgnify:FL=1